MPEPPVPQPPSSWAPLTQRFLSAVPGGVALTLLTLTADDYARDCGPLSFSDLSLDELAAARGLNQRTIRRHLNVLADLHAIERRRRPNQAARTYLHYGAAGLPEIRPLDDREVSGPDKNVPSGPDLNAPLDSDRTKMSSPNSYSLSLADREREIELGPDKNVPSGSRAPEIQPIAGAVQAPLQVPASSLRWTLSFSLLELERLKAAFPRVALDDRWRQWLAWVAADPGGRLPHDKFAAFYGWLKRSLDAGSSRSAELMGGPPTRRRPLDEQAQRDMDRWRQHLLSGMEQAQ